MLSRPWSCDTFYVPALASATRAAVFGKNSDRPARETQPLRYWPARDSDAGARLRLAYREIPEAGHVFAHLGASPYWCWGHEFGLNEHGVTIGNEALFTRDLAAAAGNARAGRPPESGLLGMELVRLGLERAATAEEAVTVITDLLEQYGQWGAGVTGKPVDQAAYDNSYLIADPHEGWVLETSGHRWVARRVADQPYSISNQATIRTTWDRASTDLVEHALSSRWWPADDPDFDFARAYSDPLTPLQVSHPRLQRSRQLLAEAVERGGVSWAEAARVLRDHYEGTFLAGPYFSAGLPDLLSLCMHDSPAGFTWGNTAGSTITILPTEPDRLPHLWWAATTPCTSVYLPVFPAAGAVPATMALPQPPDPVASPEAASQASEDPDSYWWHFQRLLEAINGDPEAHAFAHRQPIARDRFDALETQWHQQLPDIERRAAQALRRGDDSGRELLADFTQQCATQALSACDELIHEFSGAKAPLTTP